MTSGSGKPKLAILISGRGSNMLAIARACESGELNAQIALVLSNRRDAAGISAADALGISTDVIEHTAFTSRDDFDSSLRARLELVDPDWIVLAGFMRILGKDFVQRWKGRILNIHPSLLPAYPGLNTHERAIKAGDKEAGASVHLVTPELDAGPVVEQVRVPVLPTDTPETLAQRVIEQEHILYVNALKQCVNIARP
ncbi:MAG: phosphoribosylglycinamide formyltransferase [Granulosicoccus sp.]